MNQIAIKRALDGKTPPTEFLVIPLGELETVKGTFRLDRKDAESVLAQREDRGVDLQIDYEHASIQKPGEIAEGAPAAGWFKLELRADGLWAVNVKWTPRATEFLKNGEYRYFSPVLAYDKDGHVKRLINLALTNDPAIKDLPPLVSLKREPIRVHLASGVGLSVDDISRALIEAIRAHLGIKDTDQVPVELPWICDLYPDDALVVYGWQGKRYRVSYRMNGTSAELAGSPEEVVSSYSPVAQGDASLSAGSGRETSMAIEPKDLEEHGKALKACTEGLTAHGKGMEALKASLDGLTEHLSG